MAMVISEEMISNTYGVIRGACYGTILENMESLAAAMRPMRGTSELADQAAEACKAAQEAYNDGFLESLKKILHDFEELDAIQEWLRKSATVGDVAKVDASFQAGSIDADSVIV